MDKVSVIVNDALIVDLTNDIMKLFKKRFLQAGDLRRWSGTIQVVTAAAAGLIGISEHEETELIAALSGLSAIITPIQKIWKAGESAMAFEQGFSMIMEAENRFYDSRAGNHDGVSTKILTREGAQLFKEVTKTVYKNSCCSDSNHRRTRSCNWKNCSSSFYKGCAKND